MKKPNQNRTVDETATKTAIIAYFISKLEIVDETIRKDVRAAIIRDPEGCYKVVAAFITWERRTWGEEVKVGDFRIKEKGLECRHYSASSLREAATIIHGLAEFDTAKIEASLQELEANQEQGKQHQISVEH